MVDQLSVLSGMGQNVINLVIVIVGIIILTAVIVVVLLGVLNARKYKQFKIMIWEKDGFGHTMQRFDEGGVFTDGKTGNKRLFLKHAKVGLDPDNIPYLPTIQGEKWVYLLRTGLKNFKYISPQLDDNFINFIVGEEDVNWAVNIYEAQKKRFQSNWLQQYLPFIIIGFTSIIVLIMFIWLVNKLAMIKDIADAMREVATLLVQARSGTTIIPK